MNRHAIKKAQKELEEDFKHVADYLRSLMRGTEPHKDLPPALKVKVDNAIDKHAKVANHPNPS